MYEPGYYSNIQWGKSLSSQAIYMYILSEPYVILLHHYNTGYGWVHTWFREIQEPWSVNDFHSHQHVLVAVFIWIQHATIDACVYTYYVWLTRTSNLHHVYKQCIGQQPYGIYMPMSCNVEPKIWPYLIDPEVVHIANNKPLLHLYSWICLLWIRSIHSAVTQEVWKFL